MQFWSADVAASLCKADKLSLVLYGRTFCSWWDVCAAVRADGRGAVNMCVVMSLFFRPVKKNIETESEKIQQKASKR